MAYKIFDKKTSATHAIKFAGWAIKNENMLNKELAEQLQKSIIRKSEKREINLILIDNIWGDDLADIQLISIFNKRIHLCYVLLIFSENTHDSFKW